MVSKSTLLAVLPPYQGNEYLRVADQDTKDIITWLLRVTPKYAKDYDTIYTYFDTGDLYSTCEGIWRFLKYNFTYDAETTEDQTVRSPAAILALDHIDCKHYSLFAYGVLSAIKRNCGDDFNVLYRLASYNGDVTPGHVFVVATDDQGAIWIDPVLAHFDERKQPSYYFDQKPGSKIAGIITGAAIGGAVNSYPALSFIAVRILVKALT